MDLKFETVVLEGSGKKFYCEKSLGTKLSFIHTLLAKDERGEQKVLKLYPTSATEGHYGIGSTNLITAIDEDKLKLDILSGHSFVNGVVNWDGFGYTLGREYFVVYRRYFEQRWIDIQRAAMGTEVLLPLMEQLAATIDEINSYCHQHQLINYYPQINNIFIEERDGLQKIVLTDFGVQRLYNLLEAESGPHIINQLDFRLRRTQIYIDEFWREEHRPIIYLIFIYYILKTGRLLLDNQPFGESQIVKDNIYSPLEFRESFKQGKVDLSYLENPLEEEYFKSYLLNPKETRMLTCLDFLKKFIGNYSALSKTNAGS